MMITRFPARLFAGTLLGMCSASAELAQPFPYPGELKPQAEFHDQLVARDGTKVSTREQWTRRHSELQSLFQHYMYGFAPPAPKNVSAILEREDKAYFGGKATKREVTIRFGPPDTPPIHLLVV